MSDLKRDLRSYIDGLEEPVSVQETMNRGSQNSRFRVPAAVLAGAAVVLLPALVLIGLRLLPADEGDVAETTAPPTTITTTTVAETTTTPPASATVVVPDLVGLSTDEARAALAEIGLELTVVEERFSSDLIGIGAQSPEPSASVAAGSTILVDVYLPVECRIYSLDLAPGYTTVNVLTQCPPGDLPDYSHPLARAVPEDADPLEATLEMLLAGPTDEERSWGIDSWFSSETADALESVQQEGPRVTVDFNDAILIGNASTSTGSMFFMAELQANLFQYPDVDEIEFQLNGSCEAFYNWLQGSCEIATRDRWEALVSEWDQQRSVQPERGPAVGVDEIVGTVFTASPVEGSSSIARVVDETLFTSGYSELGGWLLDDASNEDLLNWAIHVAGPEGEMVWLAESLGRTAEGHMIYEVRATHTLPWDEISLTGDPFLRSGADFCNLNGASDPTLVVVATLDEPTTGQMTEHRAWTIDITNAAFVEIPTDGVACEMEVGG